MATPSLRALLALAACMLALACAKSREAATSARCTGDGTPRPLGPDEASPFGEPEAIIQQTQGEARGSLAYTPFRREDSPPITSTARLEVNADPDSARLVERQQTPDQCLVALELDAVMTLQSLDGAFRESIHGTLSLTLGSTQFTGSLRAIELQGSYAVPEGGALRVEAAMLPDAASLSAEQALESSQWRARLWLEHTEGDAERRMLAGSFGS